MVTNPSGTKTISACNGISAALPQAFWHCSVSDTRLVVDGSALLDLVLEVGEVLGDDGVVLEDGLSVEGCAGPVGHVQRPSILHLYGDGRAVAGCGGFSGMLRVELSLLS